MPAMKISLSFMGVRWVSTCGFKRLLERGRSSMWVKLVKSCKG